MAQLEPMGTPFLYASFALFPGDYERAQGLFAVLQYLAAAWPCSCSRG